VEGATLQLLDVFEEHDQRATFFCLGWVAERHPGLLRTIADRGHELACHGYQHELLYDLGPEKFVDDLRRSRDAIQQAGGVAVEGYRAPSYSITERSLWALDVLADEGFRYDSSIFPIRHHRYGIPKFCRHPVRLDLGKGRTIQEFPMTTLRVAGTNLPLAGGAYLRFIPAPIFRWAFRRVTRDNKPAILYLHPWELDPGQPRQQVTWKTRINHYFNLERTEPRLRGLLGQHRFAPVGEVLQTLEDAGELPISRLMEPALPAR
jgi:polysaccharide deacetylase family protein (PEP-CTERM system associated)